MASTFQMGTLFDHYCTKMHVGSGIERQRAIELREVMHASMAQAERAAVVSAFKDGGRVLGQTLLEAPAWANEKIERAARRWAASGGTSTDATPGSDDDLGNDENARWLDRASGEVEQRLGLGEEYLVGLVRTFERRWREAERAKEAALPPGGAPPPAPEG
jgi:hypothetical protein